MSICLLYRASLSALFRMVFETSPKVMLLPSTLCTRAVQCMIHAELSAIDTTVDWSFLSFFCQSTLCGPSKCANRSCQSPWCWSQTMGQHIPHIQLSCLSNQDHLGKKKIMSAFSITCLSPASYVILTNMELLSCDCEKEHVRDSCT